MVVLSVDLEEIKMGLYEVWDVIIIMEFKIYMGVSCGLIVLLMYFSFWYGNCIIFIDLGLVGLFGGYIVFLIKGVFLMFLLIFFGVFIILVIYVFFFVFFLMVIMQVCFFNKVFQRFDFI